jgi:hypothetical protein
MLRKARASRRKPGGWMILCATVLAATAVLLPAAGAQSFGLKNVQGKVLDGQDAPINGAIVYLENKRNNNIKTFISTDNGSYRFADLAADTDYSVWAAFHGKKSAQKTVSSFDTRKQVNIDLKIK